MRIQNINNFNQLCEMLEINSGHLWRLINHRRSMFFHMHEIPKKNGGIRTLYIPQGEIKVLQAKLLRILENSFRPHFKAHGFVSNRSIVSNASLHLNKTYLLNIDLKDFFTNISSGRVRSMFINYFGLDNKVASVLTDICCHPGGFLPQGSPTSPIISNIIAKSLDKELHNFSKLRGINYSRYADDLTFSSNHSLNNYLLSQITPNVLLSGGLEAIIENNGFEINYRKIRYSDNHQRQEVTGIKVNEKLNIDRRFIRNIRAVLFSIEKNTSDLSIPINKFRNSNNGNGDLNSLLNVLKGKINYIAMIKGKYDSVFTRFAERYNDLLVLLDKDDISLIYIPSPFTEHKTKTCLVPQKDIMFVDKDDDLDDLDYGQATGFLLKDYGVISNYHVFEYIILALLDGERPPREYYLDLCFGENQNRNIKAKIKRYSEVYDLVILELEESSLTQSEGYIINKTFPSNNDDITIIGYPDYEEGDEIKVEKGEVLRKVSSNPLNHTRFEVNQTIFGGNSGGPVLNKDGRVIGVATEGNRTTPNRVVPIRYLDCLETLE